MSLELIVQSTDPTIQNLVEVLTRIDNAVPQLEKHSSVPSSLVYDLVVLRNELQEVIQEIHINIRG